LNFGPRSVFGGSETVALNTIIGIRLPFIQLVDIDLHGKKETPLLIRR
jgi:hypothetical protein